MQILIRIGQAAKSKSEHKSLTAVTGLTNAVSYTAGVIPQEMSRLALTNFLSEKIKTKTKQMEQQRR